MPRATRNYILGFDAVPCCPGYRKDISTAMHEASHAAAALLLGIVPREMSIALDGSVRVLPLFYPAETPLSEQQRATYQVAGIVGEWLTGCVETDPERYRGDFHRVRRIALDCSLDEDQQSAFYLSACAGAEALLLDHWPGVLALANELMGRRSLDEADIRQVFKEAITCMP
jgi:hypothetical protein